MGRYDSVPTIQLNDPLYNKEKKWAGKPRWSGNKTGVGTRYLTTWYTCEVFKSWVEDDALMERLREDKVIAPNRTHVLYERARPVYYSDGRFYRTESRKNEDHVGSIVAYVPINAVLYTVFPDYMRKNGLPDAQIVVRDGYPVRVVIDGDYFDVDGDSWPAIEAFLGLDEMYKPERFRPNKVA